MRGFLVNESSFAPESKRFKRQVQGWSDEQLATLGRVTCQGARLFGEPVTADTYFAAVNDLREIFDLTSDDARSLFSALKRTYCPDLRFQRNPYFDLG